MALILIPTRPTGFELLLIKRAVQAGDPWSGQMALPGGRREESDYQLLDTARRETREETGAELTSGDLLGELDDLYPNIKVLPQVVVRPFVFGLSRRPDIHPSHEVAAHLWTSLAELRASGRPAEVEVRGDRRTVDAFVLGDHVVWGMTYRILLPFLSLVA